MLESARFVVPLMNSISITLFRIQKVAHLSLLPTFSFSVPVTILKNEITSCSWVASRPPNARGPL
jgi:hypothetical protein